MYNTNQDTEENQSNNQPGLPLVTLILPCRNEELFIEECILSIINNDYPHDKIELLVVDGLSTDNTVNYVSRYKGQSGGIDIRIITNDKKIFPAAVNAGFNNSKGEYIFILGAHAIYEKNYISGCIDTALRTGADNTGGILITDGLNKSIIGKAITMVLSNSFGVGNSTFRTGSDKETEVDTVFGGCYKRSVFEKNGLFNENLVSSSDMDFNIRLKKSGGRIILNPDVKAKYYTRTDFAKFMRNNFRNGYWAIYPMRFVSYVPVSIRHLIPLIFFSGIIAGGILSFFSDIFKYIYLFTLIIYFLAALAFSVKYSTKNLLYILIMPVLFFLLHFVYGLGSAIGSFKVITAKIFNK